MQMLTVAEYGAYAKCHTEDFLHMLIKPMMWLALS